MEFISKDFIQKNTENTDIEIFNTIDSTNDEALRQLNSGYRGNKIIFAYEQTNGRGRIGRKFYSPKYNGLYMSFIIPYNNINPLAITAKTAVSVAKSLSSIVDKDIKIKWVNDLLIEDKKICGILTEGFINYKTNKLEYIIVGIGINLNNINFYMPEYLSDIATSIDYNENINYSNIISNIYNDLLKDYDFLEYYKNNSYIIGKNIYYIENNIRHNAKAIDITEEGYLKVIDDDNTKKLLNTGEITVRKHK